ncbi:peptidyl-tRNA hydrolase [Dictyobacter aurantiacus]|uniref:Peptidyl-tRNA hydrolase n=1 Tax=Dictyobacter aurantiacus TaxID=1936993 RepID=A0A401ZA03_9CHLR|nr:aminoacyl-tRNA hydrolase [Dictyobacter aurantiacus]GCE03636.1 peptidyl-tRNA hydrolase [Dictyobacter aurantiacus]
MKLIIGLGNPGSQYEKTRHNVGFHVVDLLAHTYAFRWERRGRAVIASGTIGHEKVVLVKPTTYMNNSGEAVGELVRWFKIAPEDILVIYDELDLPIGHIRLRARGSSGGHNGINSLISHLHTNEFPRLRVGIGRPANKHIDTINHVLGVPASSEQIELEIAESKAAEAVPLYLEKGLDAAMNIINVDPEAQRKAEEKRRLKQERREQEKKRKEEEFARQAGAQAGLPPTNNQPTSN